MGRQGHTNSGKGHSPPSRLFPLAAVSSDVLLQRTLGRTPGRVLIDSAARFDRRRTISCQLPMQPTRGHCGTARGSLQSAGCGGRMPTRYSTIEVAPGERSRNWHDVIGSTYFPLNLRFREPQSFNGELAIWSLGNLSLSRLKSDALAYERLPHHLRNEREEQYLITIPAATDVTFSQCKVDIRCKPGGLHPRARARALYLRPRGSERSLGPEGAGRGAARPHPRAGIASRPCSSMPLKASVLCLSTCCISFPATSKT